MEDTSPTTDGSTTPDVTRADRIEITEGGLHHAEAGSISVTQGGISTASAAAIDVHQGGIGRAEATDIAVSTGAIGLARGATVSLDRGALGAAIGGEVRVTQSFTSFVGSRDATVDQSLVRTLIGSHVTLRQPSAIGILIAARVDGDVRPVIDWRGALAIGAVAGVIVGLLRRR
jgi:hypothetical protein